MLFRGEYDKRRDQVQPATPALSAADARRPAANRLGLAHWLLRPDIR